MTSFIPNKNPVEPGCEDRKEQVKKFLEEIYKGIDTVKEEYEPGQKQVILRYTTPWGQEASLYINYTYAFEKQFKFDLLCATEYVFRIYKDQSVSRYQLPEAQVVISTYHLEDFKSKLGVALMCMTPNTMVTETALLEMKDISVQTKDIAYLSPIFTYLDSLDLKYESSFDSKKNQMKICAEKFVIVKEVLANDEEEWTRMDDLSFQDLNTDETKPIIGIESAEKIVLLIIEINRALGLQYHQ